MNKKIFALSLIAMVSLTNCSKNNKEVLTNFLNQNNNNVITGDGSLLSLNDEGKFNVFATVSDSTVEAGFLGTFNYSATIGEGYFRITYKNSVLAALGVTVYTSDHYYQKLELERVYDDNTGGNEQGMKSIINIMISLAKRSVNNCTAYLLRNDLPYLY